MADNNFKTLEPKKSLALWRQGKDTWNAWVEENPEYNISFLGVYFSQYREEFPIISFAGFNFSKGNISFVSTRFGDGDVNFVGARFGDGDVNFIDAEFGDGSVHFIDAQFGDGDVHFIDAEFGDGGVNFKGAQFGVGTLDFRSAKFGGSAFFFSLKNIKDITFFSFQYAVFDGPFDISSDERFLCLIDLTHTKTSHHVSLEGVRCKLSREAARKSFFFPDGDWATQKVVKDSKDIARARRLKELAEGNKDHDAAKDFHVLEMQAKRVHSKCPIGYLWNTEFWYEKLSDYGRSITRPLLWMAHIWWVWTIAYMMVSFMETEKAQFVKSAVYSVAQMFAFIPSSRDARSDIGKVLFCKPLENKELLCEPPPDLIYALTFSQSILALMLLFLLGLGLRHRYRI